MSTPMRFSIFFFTAGEAEGARGDKYRAVIDAARFADASGFEAVWVPERHFMSFGALFPTPAVLLAALARETTRIGLRAGSVVLPLHDPLRVAEDWAMLDNLSGGRAGMACASGWQPNDFILRPGGYAGRQTTIYQSIETLRHLWSGGAITRPGDLGHDVTVRLTPTPVQPSLPLWLTTAGNPETFRRAGAIGANLLTYLALHDIDGLTAKIALYRQALRDAGHDPASRRVTVWAQVFVGPDEQVARRHATAALAGYFLTDAHAVFSGLAAHHTGQHVDFAALSPADLAAYGQLLADRLAQNGMAIFGSPESCRPAIARLQAAGVDEVACQLDMGIAPELMQASLPHLARLRDLCAGTAAAPRAQPSLAEARARCPEPMEADAFYAALDTAGFQYGPAFRGVRSLQRGQGDAVAQLALPAASDAPSALIDAAIQVMHAAMPPLDGVPVFAGIGRVALDCMPSGVLWAHACAARSAAGGDGDVTLFDDAGARIGEIAGVRIRVLPLPQAPPAPAYVLRRRPIPPPPEAGRALQVLVLAEPDLAEAVARHVIARGHRAGILPGAEPPDVVVCAHGLLTEDDARGAAAAPGMLALLRFAQALPAVGWAGSQRLIVAGGGAATQGFARALAHEMPEFRLSLLNVAPNADAAARLAELAVGDTAESELAVDAAGWSAARLQRLPLAPQPGPLMSGEALYLVTGGLGALGLQTAAWLADEGARHVLLAGRRPPGAAAEAAIATLRGRGVTVRVAQADVAEPAGVAALTAAAPGPPLRGVFHAAGVLDDGIVLQQTPERLARVAAPKADAAWLLHDATRGLPLDHFVMFSSAAAILGAPGQANYAAANAALAALARHRRALGLPALAVAWGPWAGEGMRLQGGEALAARMVRSGLRGLAPAGAFASLAALLRQDEPEVMVIDADWSAYRSHYPGQLGASLFADIVPAAVAAPVPVAPQAASERSRRLAEIAADVLGCEPAAIDPEQSLAGLGLDSLMAVVLRNRVARELGADVPLARLLEGISVAALADLIVAADATPRSAPAGRAADLLAQLDTLDEAAMDVLLAELDSDAA